MATAMDLPLSVKLRFVRAYEWLRSRKIKVGKVPFKLARSADPQLGVPADHFDCPLHELDSDQFETISGLSVPRVFYNLADHVVQRNGRTTVGIFRTCGSATRMAAIREAINANRPIPDGAQIADLAGLMKMYLRDQPISLLGGVREVALAAYRSLKGDELKVALIAAINLLPPRSFDLFVFLSKYLALTDYTVSKMTEENLGLVFSECLFYGSNFSQEIPKAKQLEDRKILSEVLATYISLNRTLQGLPACIQAQNDGDDIDQINKTFTLVTSERRKRRMSLKGSEIFDHAKAAARSIKNQATKMTRRKSMDSRSAAGYRTLAPISLNVASTINQTNEQCENANNNGNTTRMLQSDRESVKRKSDSIRYAGFGQENRNEVEAIKRRRQHGARATMEQFNILPATTRRGTLFRSPFDRTAVRTRANPSFRQHPGLTPITKKFAAQNSKIIMGDRADPTPGVDNATSATTSGKRTERRRLSIRLKHSRREAMDALNTSVWSTLKRSNPDQGETILDVLTNAQGPIVDSDGSEVYMV